MSNVHKNLLILNELLPLYGCLQECCQRDDLVEHFAELFDVGQKLIVESNPQFLDCLKKYQQQVRNLQTFLRSFRKTRNL
jgi:hypothetical protein